MYLAPLRQRNFGLLWWAGLISITGDWALRIALPIYVLFLTGSAAAVSKVVLASFAASLMFGTVAGAYTDRWDRRRTIVFINVLQALVLLPLLAVDSASRVWVVIVVAFAEATLAQFLGPAENALLPRLVDSDQLAAANALNALNNHIGRLVGPALGGLVAATLGLSGAALADAVSFLAAATLCAMITGLHRAERPLPDPSADVTRRRLLRELVDGLGAVIRNRTSRAILVFVTATAIGEGMMGTLFAVYVTRALDGGGREMGLLMSAQAVGGIAGSLLATRVADRFRPVALSCTCFVLFGVVDLAIFNYPRWSTVLWPVIAMFILVGLPGGVGFAALMTLFQTQMPDHLRGRSFAVMSVGQALAGMLGAGLAGWLGQTVNVVTLLTWQGLGYVFAGILMRIMAGRGPDSLRASQPSVEAISVA